MDLRHRLLACLSAGFAALLVAGALLVATSLRDDVQDELEGTARLVALVLQAAQAAAILLIFFSPLCVDVPACTHAL